MVHIFHNRHGIELTSYVKVLPEEVDWRSVTFEIVPVAERMHIARDPCWEDIIFMVTS